MIDKLLKAQVTGLRIWSWQLIHTLLSCHRYCHDYYVITFVSSFKQETVIITVEMMGN